MEDSQFERYSRQMILGGMGRAGQERINHARVLVLGLGGLGSPVTLYLAAAGVGTLVLVDFDNVDLSNLQRQIVHRTADVGRSKVESAADAVRALNPEVKVIPLNQYLQGAVLREQIAAADLVIDASDNFETRYAVNELCVRERKPLVSGAAIRMEGQVAVFRHDQNGPCYRCLYRDDGGEGADTCSLTGVLGPLVGVIGSLQAAEAIKILAGIEQGLAGRLLLLDGLSMEWRSLKLRKDPACPVCGTST
jgi:adenylyltransferase/sulfurtransferase